MRRRNCKQNLQRKRPSEISDGLKHGNQTDVGLHLFFSGVDGALVRVDQDFNAAVLCTAFNSGVRSDGLTGAVTKSAQTGAAYAAGLQEGGNRFGAVARQWLVDGVVTGVVGVAVDGQSRIRILNQSLRGGRQSALSLAAQGGAAGGEGYVFRHHQFDLVALAFDFDIGVGQALTQFFLLVMGAIR